MRVTIEIETDDELRRVREVLESDRVEVRTREARPSRAERKERFRKLQQDVTLALPEGFRFDREELYQRGS
jgi:hypothetical protein